MTCLRCGYCCIAYDVIIIDPKYISPDLDLQSPEITKKLILKKGGEVCPYLQWKGNKAICSIHQYKWYKDTPCAHHNESNVCRIGQYIRDNNINVKQFTYLNSLITGK